MAADLVYPSTSDTSPHILLHPLALIAIDDHVSRSGIRRTGPIVGALLGRNNGKEIIAEQTFECGSKKLNGGQIDQSWFSRMVKLQSEIHPALSLIGWYTVGSEPQPWHTGIQAQLKDSFECDSPIFLLYQPQVFKDNAVNGRLPFSMYEGIITQTHDDGDMDVDYKQGSVPPMKFRSISYSLETAPDEAIGLADIMQGASTAIAIAGTSSSSKETDKSKGKAKEQPKEIFTPEEDEQTVLSSIKTKYNAVKMLQSRLDLITAYLKAQPASYLTDASLSPADSTSPIDHEVIRSIAALAAELQLTSPAKLVELTKETQQAKTDGKVLQLLAQLTEHASDVKMLGRRVHVAEPRRRKEAAGQPSMPGLEGLNDWS
ncbi:hypothetical protein BT63DRAFT_435411 [Microthyrium microscopicum]|uniref:COP9 signalosome complex subunit 6 n=1 Tax=Microthyrium microscopicum TaxID=703497 RepID=A0A6A6UPT1_9PEZI|nr:hypothetical protein BT63DRAFT_435411 [Microthyrium microscopicum]